MRCCYNHDANAKPLSDTFFFVFVIVSEQTICTEICVASQPPAPCCAERKLPLTGIFELRITRNRTYCVRRGVSTHPIHSPASSPLRSPQQHHSANENERSATMVFSLLPSRSLPVMGSTYVVLP